MVIRGILLTVMLVACGRGGGSGPARLRPDEPVHGTLTANATRTWRVDVPAGQLVTVTLELTGLEAELFVLGPQGGLAACAQRSVLPRSCSAIAVAGGVTVSLHGDEAVRGAEPGRFTLTLAPPRAPTDADRQRLVAEAAEAAAMRDLALFDAEATARALEHYARARPIYQALGDADDEGDVLLSIAHAHTTLGDLPASRAAAEEALARWRTLGPAGVRGEIQALERIGFAQVGMGDVDGGRASYDRAVGLARDLPPPAEELARALSNRSRVLIQTEQWEEAIATLTEASEIHAARRDRAAAIFDDHNLAHVHASLRDYDRALALQLGAVARARDLGDAPLVATTVKLLAILHLLSDDPAAAAPLAEESLALTRPGGDPMAIAGALLVAGTARRKLGDARGALVHHREAIELHRADAFGHNLDAALIQLGEDHAALGERDDAAAAFREAIAVAGTQRDLSSGSRARVELARTLRGTAPAEARETLAEALRGYEQLRGQLAGADARRSYFTGVRSAYELDVELLVDAGRGAEAFASAERARARTLLEALRGATMAPDVRADEVRAWLPADTALVELALAPQRSVAWIVTRDAVRVVELGPRAPLEVLARAAVAHAGARDLRVDGETAEARLARVAAADAAQEVALRQLSFRLWRPLAAALAARRLVIVPDGALHLVPFAALPHPDTDAPLVETHELVSLPSASVLRELRELRARRGAADQPRRVAVLADPVFERADPRLGPDAAPPLLVATRGDTLVRLHASRDEAAAIAARFPGRSFVALDTDASAATLAAPAVRDADVLHIATHGTFDLRFPERTALVLSRYDATGAAVDGVVGLERIAGLELSAELAVLSACHTAVGPLIVGEGVRGLNHAFLAAGVPRVIASLWAVQDQATAALMTELYAALATDAPAAAALRAAQRALRRDPRYRAPYFWAGFVAHGDWT